MVVIVVVEVVLFDASLFSTLDSSAGLLEHISFSFNLLLVWMMCCGVDVSVYATFLLQLSVIYLLSRESLTTG